MPEHLRGGSVTFRPRYRRGRKRFFSSTDGRKLQLAAEEGNSRSCSWHVRHPEFFQIFLGDYAMVGKSVPIASGSASMEGRTQPRNRNAAGARTPHVPAGSFRGRMRCSVGQSTLDLLTSDVGCGVGETTAQTPPLYAPGKSCKPAAPRCFLPPETAGHERIARCCPRSLAIGIARGMSVAEARAATPSVKRPLPFDQAISRKCSLIRRMGNAFFTCCRH